MNPLNTSLVDRRYVLTGTGGRVIVRVREQLERCESNLRDVRDILAIHAL